MSANKNIAILGAGESGVGAAVLAQKQGFTVFVSDKGAVKDKYKKILIENGIEWEEGTHTLEKILKASEVIKSPGIPDKIELIQLLNEKRISRENLLHPEYIQRKRSKLY